VNKGNAEMSYPIGSLEKAEKNLPSNNLAILTTLKCSKVSKLTRYSWWTPEESAKECEIPQPSVFCLTAGPILITLESGLVIGFASFPGLASVTMWIEETDESKRDKTTSVTDDNELYPIDAVDPIYSNELIGQLIGKKIVAIKVLQRDKGTSRMQALPREYGVILEFDNGSELVMSHGLHDNSDTFSVIFRNQIQPDIVKDLREMIVI
jgi:hypothetical protein